MRSQYTCGSFSHSHWRSCRRLDIRFLFAYTICMPDDEKQRGALLIAACLIAAIRLRGEPIQPNPKLKATISDSVQLAVFCLLYTSPSPRDGLLSRMPSSA